MHILLDIISLLDKYIGLIGEELDLCHVKGTYKYCLSMQSTTFALQHNDRMKVFIAATPAAFTVSSRT